MSETNQADERVLRLARARDEGEREGRIAEASACAGAAYHLADEAAGTLDANACAAIRGFGDAIVAELRRRFGADDPTVLRHLRMRGLG